MPRYFTHLDRTNSPANELQRKVSDLLKKSSNLLIANHKQFLAELHEEIEQLNEMHPRCTPLAFSTYGSSEASIGVSLGFNFVIGFHLYEVKEQPDAR